MRHLPLQIAVIYWIFLATQHGLTPARVLVSLVPLALHYTGRRNAFHFVLPFVLSVAMYDAQRFFLSDFQGEIHVREPYELEKRLFGIRTESGILTPNELLQLHTHPVIDFFTGLSYITYIGVFFVLAVYFNFHLARRHPETSMRFYLKALAPQIMWAFLVVNVLGVLTYFLYPASPPWYVAAHGLGPVKPEVGASMAGCARFDEMLGLGVFKLWYGNSANAHGALPSLHVAYPFQAMLYAFKFRRFRLFASLFYLLVAFAAVYLNHHYLIDVILGSLYAGLAVLLVDTAFAWKWRSRDIVFERRRPLRLPALAS